MSDKKYTKVSWASMFDCYEFIELTFPTQSKCMNEHKCSAASVLEYLVNINTYWKSAVYIEWMCSSVNSVYSWGPTDRIYTYGKVKTKCVLATTLRCIWSCSSIWSRIQRKLSTLKKQAATASKRVGNKFNLIHVRRIYWISLSPPSLPLFLLCIDCNQKISCCDMWIV